MNDYIYPPPVSLPAGSDVIAYLRDSGGPNQEESIGQQERAILDYCKEYGLALRRIYSDTASGRKTKNRTQFLEMVDSVMTCADDARPCGLLLWAYSRFSRDVADFNYYLYGLLTKGLIVHSMTEQIPEGLTGQIILSLKAYTNADFSLQLGKQIKRGIAERVKAGYNNGGTPPKGYRIVREYHDSRRNGQTRIGVKWEIDPELAPLVKLAWEMRAQGKGYGEITKATGGKLYTSKNTWVTHFKNKSYLGIGKAGALEIPNHHEPLISWELWEAVQKVRESMSGYGTRGKPLHHRRISYPSLLSGLAVCSHCGAAMILHTAKNYRCYVCGNRDRKGGFSDCPNARSVNARKVDSLVLDVVLNKILSPSFVEDLLADIQNQMMDTSALDREISEENNLLILTERSITRLLQLAEGTGDIEEIAERLKKLKQEKTQHAAHIKILKAKRKIEIPELTPEALPLVFESWRKQIQNVHQSGDMLMTRKIIAQFVSKIEMGCEAATIHYVFPLAIISESSGALCAHSRFRQGGHKLEIPLE